MKSALASLTIALGLVAAQAPAYATSLMPPRWDAQLTHMQLDEQLPYKDQVETATIHLDYQKKTATLVMPLRFHCPAGRMCAQMMPAPVVIKLPIVAHSTEQCGSRVVVARADLRRVDGALQTLTIRDNTSNHCPTFAALEATEVVYETAVFDRRHGGEVKTRSTFSGDALRPEYSLEADQAE